MFKRLFVLVLITIATVSVSTPTHAATESLSIYCENISHGYIYCDTDAGYSSYTWTRREAPWPYTGSWTTPENFTNFGCEVGHGQYISVTSAGGSSATAYMYCSGW